MDESKLRDKWITSIENVLPRMVCYKGYNWFSAAAVAADLFAQDSIYRVSPPPPPPPQLFHWPMIQ